MSKIKNKIGGIFAAVCELAVGILLFIDAVAFTKGIITFFGVIIALLGVVSVIGYFRQSPAEAVLSHTMARGLLEIILGVFCAVKSDWFLEVFSVVAIIYGIATLVVGAVKIEAAFDMLRLKNKNWLWLWLSALITIICAVVIMANPFETTKVLWIFSGVSLTVEGIIDLLCAIFSGNADFKF